MISEERLRELIDNKKDVWIVNNDRVSRIRLTSRYAVSVDEYNKANNCEPMLYSDFCGIFTDICPISQAFETEEEATEYLKYGNVTRTEKLELPMWKDVKRAIKEDAYIDFRFVTYNDNLYSLEILPYDNIVRICDESICLFFQELTRENYHKALDLCVKLFKGEE